MGIKSYMEGSSATVENERANPWTFSMSTAFIVLYLFPYLIGKGIGPYTFNYTGSLFIVSVLLFFIYRPSFSVRVRDIKGCAYFIGLPILAAIWWVYIQSSNAAYEFVHLLNGAVTILLMLWFLRTPQQIRRAIVAAKFAALILVLRGGAEIILGAAQIPTAGFSNPNYLTTYLALITPILLVEAVGLVGKARWDSLGLLALIVIITILAGSRANLLAITVQAAIVSWQKLSQRRSIIRWILQGFFILLIVGFSGLVFQSIVTEGGSKGSLKEQISEGSGSAFIRTVMIVDGVRLFVKSKGLGVGAGNVTYNDSSQPYFGKDNEKKTIYPLHNFLIQLAAQYGITGVLLFVYTSIHIFKNVSKYKVNDYTHSHIEITRLSMLAFAVSFVMISISVSYMFDRRPFYFAFGLYIVVNQYLVKRPQVTN